MRPNFFRERTRCGRGHLYTAKSTHKYTFTDDYGNLIHRRRCRVCDAESARNRRAAATKRRLAEKARG